MAFLLACVVQSELGDFDPRDHTGRYVHDMKIIPNQSEEKLEQTVTQMHQTDMKGQSPAEAELSFLKKASQQETYGVDPFSVKDHKGNQMNLGINHSGILVFQGNRKTQHYSWKEIQKITYEGRMFIIHIIVNDKKMLMGYKCSTSSSVHFLWRTAIEQKYFFTSSSSSEVPVITAAGGFFAKSVKVRYRCVSCAQSLPSVLKNVCLSLKHNFFFIPFTFSFAVFLFTSLVSLSLSTCFTLLTLFFSCGPSSCTSFFTAEESKRNC